MTTPRWALSKIREAKEKNRTYLNLTRIDNKNFEPLTEIPNEVFEFDDLYELSLGNNKISNIPEKISKFRNLRFLVLGYNKLSVFPDSISGLKSLEILDLSHNEFADIPESISELRKLTALYLEGNNIVNFPKYVVELQSLKQLFLSGSELLTPPVEIAARGLEAVREYFRQLEEQGQDKLYEAKMLILGEPGAGKTTLAKKIQNQNYHLQDEITTEGVDVNAWLFPVDEEKMFRVNLWDFGGQEIYHATHQFFLTKRSLYVLVADTRKEDTDFYYWLSVVELLSGKSPLLIVKNEKQDRHREINERQLRGQFENLKAILSVNFATNRGLDRLNSEIKHYVKSLPHVGSPLPKSWVRVREILEKDSRNYISLDEYLAICKENGFLQIKDSLQLSGYLHDIGVFLHFQDEPLLKKTVILKPKWGTAAAYEVLDNKNVIKQLGRFTRDELSVIWRAPEYENMHYELLQLMMKFKLCYEIPGSDGVYIAPQLLTENQPVYEWDEEDSLYLRYTYEFMPKGILLKLIVSLNNYIVNNGSPLIWRSGFVIVKDKSAAEIIEHYGKREIRIKVAGAHKKELMTIIMYELDLMHATYSKHLKYDKLISCNCGECRVSINPHFYRFEILQKFIEDKQEQIQCPQSYKMVFVYGLVDDVMIRNNLREEHESPLVQNIYYGNHIDQGEKKMTKINQIIKNSTIQGSIVAAESIKDSFNLIEKADIKEDLREQLKQLNQAVETIVAGLSKEKAEEVADDMKRLVEEAVKPSPSKKWYSVSIEGLTKAAESLGKVGEPVIKLAGKVLALLATV